MKLQVIADAEGNIVASVRMLPEQIEGEDAPTRMGVIPGPGQTLHEVEVPDSVAKMSALEFHQNFRLEVKHPVAELIDLRKR